MLPKVKKVTPCLFSPLFSHREILLQKVPFLIYSFHPQCQRRCHLDVEDLRLDYLKKIPVFKTCLRHLLRPYFLEIHSAGYLLHNTNTNLSYFEPSYVFWEHNDSVGRGTTVPNGTSTFSVLENQKNEMF